MYLDRAVLIPKTKGISYKKVGESCYVLYELGRKYDPDKQYTVPERVQIGLQIPAQPDMMLPNENYLQYFSLEMEKREEKEMKLTGEYEEKRQKQNVLRELFLSMYHEMMTLSKKLPGETVNEEKVVRLNKVLEPLREMLQQEEYADFLEMSPMPEEEKGKMKGLTYSDVAILLNHYKNLMNRYFRKRF